MKVIDLNSDMGESFGVYRLGMDEELVKWVTSANIACGFHAGDPLVMGNTVRLCAENGVQVGAHPGLPDLMGFGRRRMELRPEEVKAYISYQVGALQGIARPLNVEVAHVKPHGALYNMAWTDRTYAEAIVEAIKPFSLILVAPYGSELQRVAEREGIKVALEAFADRGYTDEGRLVKRGARDAVVSDIDEVVERALMIALEGRVKTVGGRYLDIEADTICLHGDTANSAKLAEAVRKGLEGHGVAVLPMRRFL